MKNWKQNCIGLLIISLISLIFFYPLFQQKIPFPGDLLVGNYAPYTSYSYNGYAPGGVPHKAQGPDVIKEIYPWKVFSISQFKNGEIPFWNPYNFSGNPLMANFQSAVFYPLNGIFFLLPFPVAWSLFILLTPILSGWFLYLYLREKQLGIIPALFGGVVFGFSSYMTVWMEYGNIGHTLIWLPLVLLMIDYFFERKQVRYLVFLSAILLCSFLAGYIQGFFYLFGIAFLYTLLQGKNAPKHTLLLLPVLISPLLLGLFQLFPTVSLFSSSSRGGYTLSQIHDLLNPVWYLVTVLVPDFFGNPATRTYWFSGTYIERVSYIGIAPFLFAIYSLFLKKKKKEVWFFAILSALTLILTTDFFVTRFLYLLPIPVISTTVPTRLLSMFVFCMSVLASFGLDSWMKKEKNDRSDFYPLVIVTGLFAVMWFVLIGAKLFPSSLLSENWNIAAKSLLFSSLLFTGIGLCYLLLLLPKRENRKSPLQIILIIGICCLSFFDLFRFFHRITPFSPLEFVYPQSAVTAFLHQYAGINRSWGYGSGYIESNFQTYDKTFSPEGNDPLHNKRYTEFVMSAKDGKIPEIPARPDANIYNSNTDEEFLHNQYRQKVLNILGVKYLLSRDTTLGSDLRSNNQRFNPSIYSLVWQQQDWQIYENTKSVPRIFFTGEYLVEPDPQKQLDILFSSQFDERMMLLFEKPGVFPSRKSTGSATLVSYTPNQVTIQVKGEGGYVYLSDVYDPAWHATVNGKNAPLYITNYAFRAVPVEKGDHIVTMRYVDEHFSRGVLFSSIALFAFLGYFSFLAYDIRRKR